MHAHLFAAIVLLGALGCGGPGALSPAPAEGLPSWLIAPAAPAAPAAPTASGEEPEPQPPAPGEAPVPCPVRWTPHEMHGGALSLPAELHGRMMAPLVRGLCACSRPGQILAVVARLVPERGEVTATTVDRPDPPARASRSIDACLARELGAGRYEPFRVGSDNVPACDPVAPPVAPAALPPSEPAHLGAPRRVGCVPDAEAVTTIAYPLFFDRRDER